MTDEFGATFTVDEFAKKMGLDTNSVFGVTFPESAALTNDFKLTNKGPQLECACLCKTYDLLVWKG